MKNFLGEGKLYLWVLSLLLVVPASALAETVSLQGDAENGYYINLPKEGSDVLTVPEGVTSFKLYDDGGSDGAATLYADGSLVITVPDAPEGKLLQVTGNVMTDEGYSNKDRLYIYDGEGNQGTALLDDFHSNAAIGRIVSSGTTITVRFHAYTPYRERGVDLTVELVSLDDPHSVTFAESEGGTVSAENEGDVVSGTLVTLHVTPEEGYLLKDIYVLDEGGHRLQISNGWYLAENPAVTFTMPFSHVKVYPTFTNNLTAEGGLYVNMPASGTLTLDVSAKVKSFNVYDDGGPDGYRAYSADGKLVLNSSNTSENIIWQVTGSLDVNYYDDFRIYDGGFSDGKELVRAWHSYSGSVGRKLATSKTLSFSYQADDSHYSTGFALIVSFVDQTEKHPIIINNVEGGVVTCEKESAGWGDSVSLNMTVAGGLLPQSFDVVGDLGEYIPLSGDWQMQNQFTVSFVMPLSDVTVTPVLTNDVSVENGFFVNLPTTGKKNVVLPAGATSFKVYDDGGKYGKRTSNADGSLVISAPDAPDGYVFRVMGNLITDERYSERDNLYIYDGIEGLSPLLLNGFNRNASIGTILSTGKIITIKLDAKAYYEKDGLDLKVELVNLNEPRSISVVSATGGSLEIAEEAVYGSTVQFKVNPDEGYLLKDIYVLGEDGNRLSINNDWYLNDNPTISFTMPCSKVKVYPSFTNDLTAEGGLYAKMPAYGSATLNASAKVSSFKLYDDGGPDGNTSINAYEYLTINSLSASENSVWQVTGSMNSYQYSDELVIYDGDISDNKRIMSGVGGDVASIGKKMTTGKTVAFYFHTASFSTSDGFNFTVTLMDRSESHDITIVADEGGSVTTEKETEKWGETVSLDIRPKEGYLLKSIDVVDEDGNHLAVSGDWQMQDHSTVTFTMPYSNVTVKPVFTNELTAENGIYIKLPTTGTRNFVVPAGVTSFKVYDDGGSSGAYSGLADGILVITAPDAPEGSVFLLSGSLNGGVQDSIMIYDGLITEGKALFDSLNSNYLNFENQFTSGTSATFRLKSLGGYTYSGFDVTVSFANPHQKHHVEVAPATGGIVSVSSEDVEKDSIVTINVTSANGYYLNNIKVVDAQGRNVDLVGEKFLRTSTSLTFVMPFSDVSVVADFTNELTASAGLRIDMQKTGRETYVIPAEIQSFKVYDDGGSSGNYGYWVNDTLVLKAPEGYIFLVSGSVTLPNHGNDDFESEVDAVTIYDGEVGNRKLLSVYGNGRSFDRLVTTGNILTIHMSSDDYYSASGLDLTVSLFKNDVVRQVSFEPAPGGTVTADKTSVNVYSNVNLNITPEPGKFLEKITVYDEDDDEVAEFGWYMGNSVSFTMPYSNVIVVPSFTDDISDFSINMPRTGTVMGYIPEGVNTFKLYDDGGPSGNYSSYSNGTIILQAPEGRVFRFKGNMDFVYDCSLTVNGENIAANTIYTTVSNTMMVNLVTDYNSSYSWSAHWGIDFTVDVVDPSEEHNVNVAEVPRGVMFSSHSSAKALTTVTLTGRPNKDGSVLAGVKVTDSDGANVILTKTSDSTFTFVMPPTDVAVTPSFANPTVVSFDENGCLDNGTYFHIENEYESEDGNYWSISQVVVANANVGGNDFVCWSDVYNKIEPSGSDSYYRDNVIRLESDLDFGGYDEESSKCAMAFRPIGNNHKWIDGRGHTIRNFCHDSVYAGFVTKDYSKLVRNLNFENAYVRGDTAGVLASSFAGALLNVSVKDSRVVGVWAGGIAGVAKVGVSSALVSGVSVESPENCTEEPCAAYLGGAVGYMHLVEGSIQYVRAKNVSLKRGGDAYSAYMGGLVGKLVLDSELGHSVEVSNDTVRGVSYNGAVVAGGLFGEMDLNPMVWNDVFASIDSIYVQAESITASQYAGGVVGYVSEGAQLSSMKFSASKLAVLANVSASGANSYVGGFVGYFENADASLNIGLTLLNSYSIGNIAGVETSTLGYLIGGLNDNSKFDISAVRANYHFGTDDASAYKGIGTFSDENWKSPESRMLVGNIRNAVSGLEADGNLQLQEMPIKALEKSYGNGVVPAEQMKMQKFAVLLNLLGSIDAADGMPIWSFAGSENNSSLPFHVGGKYRGITLVGIDYSSLNGRLKDAKQQILDEAIAAGTYSLESVSPENEIVALYTDYTGHLKEADVNFMQGLLDDGEYWEGDLPLSPLTVYKDILAEYVFDKNVELNIVYHICTGSISENVCVDGTEFEIRDGMDIEGYEDLGFLLKPVKKLSSNDFRTVIPPMYYTQNRTTFKVLLPSIYRLNGTSNDAEPVVDTTSAELFKELLNAISEHDLSDYGNTVHLVYALNGRVDSETMLFVSTAPFGVMNTGYGIMGDRDVDVIDFSLHGNSSSYYGDVSDFDYGYYYNGMSPLASGYKFAVNELNGFTNNYTVEFGLRDFEGLSPDTVAVANDYFVSYDDFAKNYQSTVWKKENLTADDVIRLDSIYTNLKDLSLSMDDFMMRITPQTKEYTVTFNIQFLEGVDTVDVYFGQGWDPEKPTTRKVRVGDRLPGMFHTNKFLDIGGWLPVNVGYYEEYRYFSPKDWYFSTDKIPDGVGENDTINLYTMYGQGYYEQNYEPVSISRLYATGKNGKTANPDSIHGTVALIQRVGGVDYEHTYTRMGDEYILLFARLDVSDTLDFRVETRPDPGYRMVDLTHGARCGDNPCSMWSEEFPFGLRINGKDTTLRIIPDDYGATYGDINFSARFVPNSYKVTFNTEHLKNENIILGNSMNISMLEMDVGDAHNFPSIYMRKDGKISTLRWSAEQKDRSQFSSDETWNEWVMAHTFTYLTSEVINDAFAEREDDGEITLYPIEVESVGMTYEMQPLLVTAVDENNEELSDYNDYHGSIELSQSYNTSVFKQKSELTSVDGGFASLLSMPGEYMDDTLTYNVILRPDPGYKMSIVSFDNGMGGESGNGEFGYNAETGVLKYVPSRMYASRGFSVQYDLLNYNVTFTRPTDVPPMDGDKKVDYFISDLYEGEKWVDGPVEYTIEMDDRNMPRLYAADGCVGWSKTRKPADAFYYFDDVAATTLNVNDTVFATPFEKDAETCFGVLSNTVTVHTDGRGTLEFWQFIGKGDNIDTVRHAFTFDEEASTSNDKVYVSHIPYFDLGSERDMSMSFEIHAVPAIPGTYYLDEGDLYYLKKSDEGTVRYEINDGTGIKTDKDDLEFFLKFEVNEVKLAFAVGEDGMFYGSDWKEGGLYKLGDSSSIRLPSIIYSSEKCLAGWTADSTDDEAFSAISDAMLKKMAALHDGEIEGKTIPVYALWTDDLSRCAGDYMRISIEQANGSVSFVGKNTHEFVKGSMILPNELSTYSLRIQSKPDSSYVLDSLVVFYDHEVYERYSYDAMGDGRTSDNRMVLFEGDRLPDKLERATLVAYFGKANKTPVYFAEKEFMQSRNAIQLSYRASDFEVTRGVDVKVKLVDVEADTVVLDSLLGDSIAMGYEGIVVLRMNHTGDYRVALTLADERETAEYVELFTVEGEIEPVVKNRWQMLSLAAVDTSLIDWKSRDQIFYWWDENGTGEFWQYKRFNRGDAVISTRGTWYSSLKGGSLALRSDIEDDESDVVWELDSVCSGWNLVANTHGWTVNLYANYPDKVPAADEKADVTFWRYNAKIADYEEITHAGPYEAVWAKVSHPITWTIPGTPVFVRDSTEADSVDMEDSAKTILPKRLLAKASTSERWTLQAVLSDRNGRQDTWNILGTGREPFTAEEPPASMGDHVTLSIVEGNRVLAKSIRAQSDELEWELALSATSERVGYLTLVGIDGINAFGNHVYVTVDGVTTEMQENVPLKVYLKEDRKMATVRVASALRVLAGNALKSLHVARLGNKLQVSFNATGLAGTNARLDVVDLKGHVMATVSANTVDGLNALMLDAPKSGLYMLRVRAGSQQQVMKILVK